MKLIYLIAYSLFFLTVNKCFSQSFVNQGSYWPPYAPNGTFRPDGDSTSEDWWYDVKAVPLTHPAFSAGRYIAAGYSCFDDIGLGNFYSNDLCNTFSEINFSSGFNVGDFELPDMRHLNFSGTIGLVDLTRTSGIENPYEWIYNYGLGSFFFKVIPTSDGGFLATGSTSAFNLPSPSSEVQFLNFQTGNDAILYQSPPVLLGDPNEKNPFVFKSCPPSYDKPPEWSYVLQKRHACLLKVDQKGIVEWFYTYGIVPFIDGGNPAYKNGSVGTDLLEVNDGYILAGIMQNSPVYGNLGNHGFLLKVQSDGSLDWINMYHDSGFLTEKFTAIQLKNDNEIYVTGERTYKTAQVPSVCTPYPDGSPCMNGSGDADKEHYMRMKFLPFLKDIDLSTGTENWDLPLETDTSLDYRVRSLSIDNNRNILVPVSAECSVSYASGECKNSHVFKVVDYSTSAAITQQIDFGPIRAYDLATGLGVKATTDGGFIVVGTKKTYNLNINKNYSTSPFGSGYDMTGFAQNFSQTDAFVAKCNSSGEIEWTSIFDNIYQSPGGDILTNSGNPRSQSNLDDWMNHTTDRSKDDIKRQECLYAVETSSDGEIIVGGNMSSNLDDSYIAMVDNTCDLTLSNHLIQAIPAIDFLGIGPAASITNMDNFVGSNISTGRVPGNTNDIASFDVNSGATIKMVAGEDITMYEGSDLEIGTDVDASINPSHSCTPGAIYSNFNNPIRNMYAKKMIPKTNMQVNNTKTRIMVVPNPTSGLITVKHPSAIKQLDVCDLYGKTILKISNHGSSETKIDLSNLSSGMYVLRVDGISSTVKIIKQ